MAYKQGRGLPQDYKQAMDWFLKAAQAGPLLAAYLSPHALLACVQVNHLWNTTVILILWHTIHDSAPSWEYIFRGCTPDLKTV
ncbi:hypothetical protein EC957_001362 [Mortierella hygrophila]|uniref:Uncharacterized protein n=1 Tax=Mortierella hygrophila TaxID=979708 RepID=A0A9P6F6B4_9FUNG|nr:hypothetical protein EC957_001362 [Mortierella hygrophila]